MHGAATPLAAAGQGGVGDQLAALMFCLRSWQLSAGKQMLRLSIAYSIGCTNCSQMHFKVDPSCHDLMKLGSSPTLM